MGISRLKMMSLRVETQQLDLPSLKFGAKLRVHQQCVLCGALSE